MIKHEEHQFNKRQQH